MSKVAEGKKALQIRIDAECVKHMDGALEVLNREIDASKGEKKVTRSIFIENCIKLVILGAIDMKVKVEKSKGGKRDA